MAILNRGTLVLIGCAIALGGAVLLIENRDDTATDITEPETELASTSQETGEFMFPFAESDIESFTLSRPDEVLTFDKDEDGFWRMSAPQDAEAEGGAIAFLLNQLTSTAVRSLDVAPDTLERFNLITPEVTIDLVAEGQPYQFLIGDADFTGDQRYVRAIATAEAEEEDPETIDIHLVSGSITNAVERPTEEWLVSPEADDSSEEAEESAPSEASEETGPDESVEDEETEAEETEAEATAEPDAEGESTSESEDDVSETAEQDTDADDAAEEDSETDSDS